LFLPGTALSRSLTNKNETIYATKTRRHKEIQEHGWCRSILLNLSLLRDFVPQSGPLLGHRGKVFLFELSSIKKGPLLLQGAFGSI
jgi:hypothetical protein